jgi:hypothetical protein
MSDPTYYRMDQGGQAISADHPMPVTTAGLVEGIGAPDDAAYEGSGDATVISLLKGCYAQLAIIAANTATP